MLIRRRNFFTCSVVLGALALSTHEFAAASTGIAALDDQAAMLMSPQSALLLAITRTGGRLVAVGEHGVIIYSDNAGASWRQAAVPVDLTLTDVVFGDSHRGWATGHFGVVLNTQDAGETWQIQLTGIQAAALTLRAAQNPTAVEAASPGAPMAMRRANVFVESGPDKPFFTLVSLSPEIVIAFGADRLAAMTADGGKTWSDWSLHIEDRLSHNIYDAFVLKQNIFLLGEGGLAFCSTDNGNTFAKLAPPQNVTLYSMTNANDGGLIVFGVAGSCFRTTDSGKSWTAVNVATSDNLIAGRLLQSGTIVLASETGSIFFSKNNGDTFAPLTGAPPMSIYDFVELPGHGFVFVGAGGITLVPASAFNPEI